jgi:hypothetical protein
MPLTLGRLTFDGPDSLAEGVGEAISRVGGVPVPGGRSGLSVTVALTSWADTAAERETIRRQLRSLLNNLPMRLGGLYLAWADDDEHNGWVVPGQTTFDLDGVSLDAAVWKFGSLDLALSGRPRTHRRGVVTYLRDRRLATTPRDILGRIYSTNFSGMTPLALTWLPSTITDPIVQGFTSLSLTGARTGYGSSQLQAVVSGTDLAVVSFEQAEAARNLGDVVIYDRRGTSTNPSDGPDADWEEVYGPDYPLSASDVPVLDNSLCRVTYDATNTDGFRIERWSGSAWVEQGKVLIERVGTSTAYCDTLVSAGVVEWTPERAVVRAVMKVAADSFSREEVYITLQRGWNGPRFEVYPGPKTGGAAAGAGVAIFRTGAPSGTETANKYDASLQTVTGATDFTPGAIGASTFTGENWVVMRRSSQIALILAGLQSGATGRVAHDSSAYGSDRNGLLIRHTSAAYVSAQVGMNAASTTDAIDSVNGLYDGARDLGEEVLYDSRSPQTLTARVS